MSVMADKWIRRMAEEKAMIEPFVGAQKRQGIISYGLSSYGYDARVSDEFKIFTNVDSVTVDPKEFAHQGFVEQPARSASFRPIPSPWRERLNISASPAMCWSSALASRPMPAAGLLST